jgi:hypothetical protein
VRDARENGYSLDYCPDSIQTVVKILGGLHEQYFKDPETVSADGSRVRLRSSYRRGYKKK